MAMLILYIKKGKLADVEEDCKCVIKFRAGISLIAGVFRKW